MSKVRDERLVEWEIVRRGGLRRYLVLHGVLPWGLLSGIFSFLVISLLFKFEIFSANGFYRLLSCLMFCSYCGAYFAWHRWQTEETIWKSQADGAAGDSSGI